MLQLTLVSDTQGQQHLNASFTQGDVVGWSFLLAIDGVPINLTGMNIKMTVAMPTPLVLSTENGGIIMTNAAAGQFIANIESSETAAFSPGTYNYDVWVEQNIAPPVETQYITGAITVNPSISAFP